MKTEINLRSKEFATAREFYWPRVFITLTILIFIITVLAGTVFIHLYQYNLSSDVSMLTSDRDDLLVKIKPVEKLERKVQAIKTRASLKRKFEAEVIPWSGYMTEIDNRAHAGEIIIEYLDCPPGGAITIRGWSRTMERVAAYTRELEEVDFLSGVRFNSMSAADNRVNFEIIAPIEDGG